MRTACFAYTKKGLALAGRLRSVFGGEMSIYAPERMRCDGALPLGRGADFYGPLFSANDALIFVGACGIAVRAIAPFVRDKMKDPAVICMDEAGRNVIPLLSGHIGGANELAGKIADATGARAVITTATDTEGRFAPDEWAARNGYHISGRDEALRVSAAILEDGAFFLSDLPVKGELPEGLILCDGEKRIIENETAGIYITYTADTPFSTTLRLVPKSLILGIGCRKGTAAGQIERAVATAFEKARLDRNAVDHAATIDIKSEEPGLLEWCRDNGHELKAYTAEELMKVEGTFASSAFVMETVGTDNVCERAAMKEGEKLVLGKTSLDGVTVAVALKKTEVCFDR